MRILEVGSDGGGEHVDRIGDGRREDRHAVEVATGRDQPACADQAAGRLQADDVVEAGRDASGAGRVRPERRIDETAGNRDRRPRTRSTADVAGIEAVRDRTVRRAGTDEAARELVEVRLADDLHAGRLEPLDHARRALGLVGELDARRGRGETGDVDVVLHRETSAGERSERLHRVACLVVRDPGRIGIRDGRRPRCERCG